MGRGWQEAEPANWRWSLLAINPESTELTLPPLKRDYLSHADTLLLHRLGGDPFTQQTIRIWDSGFRLTPSGQTVYLGQISTEVLVQRLRVFNYWRSMPTLKESLELLEGELEGVQIKRVEDELLLIRVPQFSTGS
jgi:hypothetical protein